MIYCNFRRLSEITQCDGYLSSVDLTDIKISKISNTLALETWGSLAGHADKHFSNFQASKISNSSEAVVL